MSPERGPWETKFGSALWRIMTHPDDDAKAMRHLGALRGYFAPAKPDPRFEILDGSFRRQVQEALDAEHEPEEGGGDA